jgi:hypothetical protein
MMFGVNRGRNKSIKMFCEKNDHDFDLLSASSTGKSQLYVYGELKLKETLLYYKECKVCHYRVPIPATPICLDNDGVEIGNAAKFGFKANHPILIYQDGVIENYSEKGFKKWWKEQQENKQ